MIAKLAGVALDARVAGRVGDSRSRALAAQWIARNALAARGVQVDVDDDDDNRRFTAARGSSPRIAIDDDRALDAGSHETTATRLIGLRATTLTGLLAALGVVPALVDPATLPRRWRLALRALGLPVLERSLDPVVRYLFAPARAPLVLAARPWLEPSESPCGLRVDATPTGYRVRIARERMLVA